MKSLKDIGTEKYLDYKHKEFCLICKKVMFYALKDEDAFFEWIKKINCIDHISTVGDTLYLHLKSEQVNDQDLDDLIALLYRYNIDMQQLKRFLTEDNKSWFYDKKAFWYKKVFEG